MSTLDELIYQLNQPRQPKRYDLFISHSWDYGDDRTNLGGLIYKALIPDQAFDSSAPKDHPIHAQSDDALIDALVQRIKGSNVLIFPAGVYASYSKWIPIEIAIAQSLGKPIIAVEKWGAQRSSTVVQAANEIVKWNGKSVADAIKKWHP